MLLTLLMNMDMAGGTVATPPIPPITNDGGGGSASFGHRKYEREIEEKERRRLNDILRDDEIMLSAIKIWLNHLN